MRIVLQRTSNASVEIEQEVYASINQGYVILLGIEANDTKEDVEWLCRKITAMRIFSDDDDKMNLSIQDIKGECLVISQFTLHASTKKGNRPSFIKAARPETAIPLYNLFIEQLSKQITVKTGVFGANMSVTLTNDGPVTINLDSKLKE